MDQPDGLERLTDVRRLLIVEDDRELRTMLERLLGDEGYHVDAVADGQAGLHRALIDRYDVMVIDRGLPAIDGLDLTRRLRGRGVATPVMILTAYGSVVDRVEGLDAGAEDYLVKPFEVDELLARLRALLRRHATVGETIQIGNGTVDLVRRIARTSDGQSDRAVRSRVRAAAHARVSPRSRLQPRRVAQDRLRHRRFGNRRRHLRPLPSPQARQGRRAHHAGSRLPDRHDVTSHRSTPEHALIRRTARRITLQTAALFAVCLVVLAALAALFILRAQTADAQRQLRAAVVDPDAITDPPAGILIYQSADGQIRASAQLHGQPLDVAAARERRGGWSDRHR